jgi:signal peptidase I
MSMQTDQPSEIADWRARVIFGRSPKRTLVRVATLIILCVVFFKYVFVGIRVMGISMSPTYRDGSINFVNRLAYVFHPPQRGDVVGIKMTGENMLYLKRIIALPGETISFDHNAVLINGRKLHEPYVRYGNPFLPWDEKPLVLSQDEYFVVGDNRSMNQYDHAHGRTTRNRIVGKVLF